MRPVQIVLSCFLLACAMSAPCQTAPDSPYFGRRNTFGILAGYSNDSSHMLMGTAENRKLLNIGASYSRRLWHNRIVNWQYQVEALPVALESDPVEHYEIAYTSPVMRGPYPETIVPVSACRDSSVSGSVVFGGVTNDYTYSNVCSRRWTIGEGLSPVGFQWNFLPRLRWQPLFVAHGGYMYSTQPIPVVGAGSFNFTFDFGVGLEMYRSKARSIRADYRFHHISDRDTTIVNPGIDNGLFTVTYSFGR